MSLSEALSLDLSEVLELTGEEKSKSTKGIAWDFISAISIPATFLDRQNDAMAGL